MRYLPPVWTTAWREWEGEKEDLYWGVMTMASKQQTNKCTLTTVERNGATVMVVDLKQ